MKILKRPLVTVSALAALALVATSAGVNAAGPPPPSVFDNTVFAANYVSTGAAGASVVGIGNVLSGTYMTLGADSLVRGDTYSGGIATLGAGALVRGVVNSPGNVFGAGATSGGEGVFAPPTAVYANQVDAKQSALNALTPDVNQALGNEADGVTYEMGVYQITGLRTYTASTHITLDAGGGLDCRDFVFNVSGYITFGAGVTMNMVGARNCILPPEVFWNSTGGYISIGAGATVLGTVIAKNYVSTGAGSTVRPPWVQGRGCGGGTYSQSGYVSIGADAKVVRRSC